jgi:archaellum biogenesis protein FlaJ (TadC family)
VIPGSSEQPTTQSSNGKVLRLTQRRRWAFVLFVLPIAAVVVPVVYNRIRPSIGGVPFFVWYQFAAVVFGGLVTGVVYVLRGTERKLARRARATQVQAMGDGRGAEPFD